MAKVNLDLFYQAGRALGRNVKAEKRTKQIQQVGKAVVDIANKIGEYKKQRQATTAKYLEDFPDDIKIADVDETLRKPITNYLTEKKKEYNDLAIQAGKFPAGTEKGIEIREAMNDIKASMSTVSKDLEFLKTTKIQAGANIKAGLSAGDEFDVDNTQIIAGNDYGTLQLKIDDSGISYFNPQSTQRENITNLKILGADDKKGMGLQNQLKIKYQGLGSNINFPFNEADARSDVENMFNSMSKEQQKNWFFSSGYADKLLQEKSFTFTPIDELREDQYDAEELNKIKQQNNSYEQEKLKLQFQDVYVNDFVINDLTDEVRDYFNANRSYVEQKQLEKENKALELAGKKADIEVETFKRKKIIDFNLKNPKENTFKFPDGTEATKDDIIELKRTLTNSGYDVGNIQNTKLDQKTIDAFKQYAEKANSIINDSVSLPEQKQIATNFIDKYLASTENENKSATDYYALIGKS